MLGENMPLRSESMDLDGVTLTFIESDFETSFEGVVYWLSLVLDLTGVLGGMNMSCWLLEEAELVARELCEVGADSDASWLALCKKY